MICECFCFWDWNILEEWDKHHSCWCPGSLLPTQQHPWYCLQRISFCKKQFQLPMPFKYRDILEIEIYCLSPENNSSEQRLFIFSSHRALLLVPPSWCRQLICLWDALFSEQADMGPISLTIFPWMSTFNGEIAQASPYSNKLVTTTLCTCHHSYDVRACANISHDLWPVIWWHL